MKLYSCGAIEGLIDRYYAAGGEALEVVPGSLGYGVTICTCAGYKTAVVTEVYLNEWASAHKVRFYNELPKKYEKMIENYWSEYEKKFEEEGETA